ncbi:MAG: alpha/beta hydrolase [Desulfamplus sp.]|nr:alpha/beta hydrolase [Desulfamplus sp.]
MSNTHSPDYTILDHPRVLVHLFHPRKDSFLGSHTNNHLLIPVADGIDIGACVHMTEDINSPTILFFHGNGEIASDYDDLGDVYRNMGINFIVVDYRGYGNSSGNPTVFGMMHDCHVILDFVRQFLGEKGYIGSLTVMGRSLGSASALELASSASSTGSSSSSTKPLLFDSLIIESGFAYASPLLEVLGISPASIGFREEQGFSHIEKIARWKSPTLIIHAEYDHIIPFTDGEALFNACGSEKKTLIKIPGANHNDIFMRGMKLYMDGIKEFLQ